MKKLRCLRIKFDNQLEFTQIPAFRAALAKLYPENSVLLHHHISDKELLHRYPLIQYKVYQNKPHIFALQEGADLVLKLIEQDGKTIQIYNQPQELTIQSLNLFQHVCQVWDKTFVYKVHNWLALNSENYQIFQHTDSLKERVMMLERLLTGHIVSFVENLQCNIYEPITVNIHRIHAQRWLKYKKIDFLTFELTFETNISLPNYMSIGKATSVGFGMIKRIKKPLSTDLPENENSEFAEPHYSTEN